MEPRGGQLFSKKRLRDQLRDKQDDAVALVENFSEPEFRSLSDQEIVECVVPQMKVEPITLQLENQKMDQEEIKVDVSGDRRRFSVPGHRGPSWVSGVRIDIEIPYTGEDWIFDCCPNHFKSVFPRATIKNDILLISIELPEDTETKQLEKIYDREIDLIKEYIGHARSQISEYNNGLEALVQDEITKRRSRLEKYARISDLLGIPKKNG